MKRRVRTLLVSLVGGSLLLASCANLSQPDVAVDGVDYSRSDINERIDNLVQDALAAQPEADLDRIEQLFGLTVGETPRMYLEDPAQVQVGTLSANGIVTLIVYRELVAQELVRRGGTPSEPVDDGTGAVGAARNALFVDLDALVPELGGEQETLSWLACRIGSLSCSDPSIPAADIIVDPRYGTWEPDARPGDPLPGLVLPPPAPLPAPVG